MKYDLHIHSTFSDGEFTPIEILEHCHKNDISVISITDHNNIFGCRQAITENPYNDITVISGIELTAKSPSNINLHILGYNLDLDNQELNDITQEIMKDSINRIKSLIYELKRNYDITFNDEDIKEVFSLQGNIGRPEIAKLCVQYGYANSVKDVFKYLFNPIKNKLIPKQVELTDKECIKLIKQAGGIASLAHPVTLMKTADELKKYIQKLTNIGLESVEVYHSNNPTDLTQELLQITKDIGLYQSLGSDFHGHIVTPNIILGSGISNNLSNKNASIINKLLEVKRYD